MEKSSISIEGRWLIVAQRLPFHIISGVGRVRSPGGLVSAIDAIHTKTSKIWVGTAPEGLVPNTSLESDDPLTSYAPQFIEPELYQNFYNGFCNNVLWPLMHYDTERVLFHQKDWQAYVKVNQLFADSVESLYREGDLVWIHDFHLLLVPKMLRQKLPHARIGFFLHVPFPSSEIFRQLPVREKVLEGMIGADLVGFHDYSYLRHFEASLQLLLGVDSNLSGVRIENHSTRFGVFPVSIDTPAIAAQAASKEVANLMHKYRRSRYVILGVDRLDYTKGLELKLESFYQLLSSHPQFRGQVSLIQIAVPTRTEVVNYQQLKTQIDQMVGKINGEFGKVDHTPVQYLYQAVSREDLLALYRCADVLLVTSKRDGLNLVALEYVAAQQPSNPGVVVLSEFAGAASLLSQALAINPWDCEGTARTLVEALTMPQQERLERFQAVIDYLDAYTATDWAQRFIGSLSEQNEPTPSEKIPHLAHSPLLDIAQAICKAKVEQIIILLDYDGTLVPICPRPEMAQLSPSSYEILRDLAHSPLLKIVVVSGRTREFLESQFSGLNISLAAEHGSYFCDSEAGTWQNLVRQDTSPWFDQALSIMQDYATHVPGSFVEQKQFCLTWHYRLASPDFASHQARKLWEELHRGLANLPVTIAKDKKVIEVRSADANKGIFARWLIRQNPTSHFVIAVGDSEADRDLFAAAQEEGITIQIGYPTLLATDYFLDRTQDLLPILTKLAHLYEALLQFNQSDRTRFQRLT